jgi:hypothetical protein
VRLLQVHWSVAQYVLCYSSGGEIRFISNAVTIALSIAVGLSVKRQITLTRASACESLLIGDTSLVAIEAYLLASESVWVMHILLDDKLWSIILVSGSIQAAYPPCSRGTLHSCNTFSYSVEFRYRISTTQLSAWRDSHRASFDNVPGAPAGTIQGMS